MQKRTWAIVMVILVVAGIVLSLQFGGNSHEPEDEEDLFDNEGRYDSSNLNYMGVIYSNRSDILNWNGGYSESTDCPWGRIHNGLDFAFRNDSDVIAAAPGIVEAIELSFLVNGTVYKVAVLIRFNNSVMIEYGFEGFSDDVEVRAHQVAMLDIEEGEWVAKGDVIGKFLQGYGGAHVHFGIYVGEATCPIPFFSPDAYAEMMELVHSFEPTWNLCYP
jgi:murein DD-endopeptidase MepM/ murein hydrolase activator NlpD